MGSSFGELALMYSKPRAASIRAERDGALWALDRAAFRAILMKSETRTVVKTLREVDVLKSLSLGQLQRLSDILAEESFKAGDYIIKQGDDGDIFYVIK